MRKSGNNRSKRAASEEEFEVINASNKDRIFKELSRNKGFFSVAVVDGPVSEMFLVRSNYEILRQHNRFIAEAYPFNVHSIISPTKSPVRNRVKEISGARYLGSLNINEVYECDLSLFSKIEEALFYSETEKFHREITFKFHRAGYASDDNHINYLVRDQLRWAMQKIAEHINYLEQHSIFSYESEKLDDDLTIENITKNIVLARSVSRHYKPELP